VTFFTSHASPTYAKSANSIRFQKGSFTLAKFFANSTLWPLLAQEVTGHKMDYFICVVPPKVTKGSRGVVFE
jgi:hypothetical protein